MKASEKSEKVRTEMCVVEGGKMRGLKPVPIGRKFVVSAGCGCVSYLAFK